MFINRSKSKKMSSLDALTLAGSEPKNRGFFDAVADAFTGRSSDREVNLDQRTKLVREQEEAVLMEYAKLRKKQETREAEYESRRTELLKVEMRLGTLQSQLHQKVVEITPELQEFRDEVVVAMETRNAELGKSVEQRSDELAKLNDSYRMVSDETFRLQEELKRLQSEVEAAKQAKVEALARARSKVEANGEAVMITLMGTKTYTVSAEFLLSRPGTVFHDVLDDSVLKKLKKKERVELAFEEDPDEFKYVFEFLRTGHVFADFDRHRDTSKLMRMEMLFARMKIPMSALHCVGDVEVEVETEAFDRLDQAFTSASRQLVDGLMQSRPETLNRASLIFYDYTGPVKMTVEAEGVVRTFRVIVSELFDGCRDFAGRITRFSNHGSPHGWLQLGPTYHRALTGSWSRFANRYSFPEKAKLVSLELFFNPNAPGLDWTLTLETTHVRTASTVRLTAAEYRGVEDGDSEL